MISFEEWKNYATADNIVLFMLHMPENEGDDLPTFQEWRAGEEVVLEDVGHTRYSIEVNYRSKIEEVLEQYAKIALGYVSAALKNYRFHVKHVYTEKPVRILISSRNWDDGEWVGVVSWNTKEDCFVLSKGFYNKDRRTVSVQGSEKCTGDSPAEITKQVHNMMHSLKDKPDRYREKLKGVPNKRGPKR